MNRIAAVILGVLALCATSLAQSRFQGQVQPGLSTRSEAEKILGQPTRTLGGNQFEYNPPPGASRLVVEYRGGAGTVEWIETAFPRPHSRAVMIRTLELPEQSLLQGMTQDGKFQEFFGEPAFLVFTYASAESSSGVIFLGYYSREEFNRTSSAAAAQLRTSKISSGASAAQRAYSAPVAPPASRNPSGQPRQSTAVTAQELKPAAQPSMTGTDSLVKNPAGAGERPGAQEPSTGTAYHGPSSGIINWSGKVEQDGLITIEGLPGIPVMIDFDSKEYAVVEPPSPSNKWKRLVLRSRHRKDGALSVRWTVIQ